MKVEKTVEQFIDNNSKWRDELVFLRSILNKTELIEGVKWNFPVYTINNKNVIGMGSFKAYFGLWFFNGSFLSDPKKVLVNAQEGKTKAMRQWRFTSKSEVDEKLILKYITEAIENQKQGKTLKPQRVKENDRSVFLEQVFNVDDQLKSAFNTLSPYKQREYIEYIETAKQETTKNRRLEKIIPMIKKGLGLNDRYR